MNNTTKLTCPVCGAEFSIAEHTHIATGVVIGKDSNLGVIHPELANPSETPKDPASTKIAALKAAGVDVSNLFSMQLMGNASQVCRMNDDGSGISFVPDDDPIFNSLVQGKTIPNRRLFRRFVMAQVLRGLIAPGGFFEFLHRKGYKYQWDMLRDEMAVQARLFEQDPENFAERNRWFNKECIMTCADNYVSQLMCYINARHIRNFQRRQYVHVGKKDILVSRLDEEIYYHVRVAQGAIENAQTPEALSTAVNLFRNVVVHIGAHKEFNMAQAFASSYMGAGAFYTLKNLILFHDFHMYSEDGKRLTTVGSLSRLNNKARAYASEGWRLFRVLRDALDKENFDIRAKIAEWRKYPTDSIL